jgi:uncharacterized HAD superfamily protein
MKSSEDKRKIIAIDLDGTLTKEGYFPEFWDMTLRELDECYEKMVPINEMVEKLRELKDRGFIIYIYTSRWDLFQTTTLNWLKKNNIPHDFIVMNKAFFHSIYDDKSKTPEEIYSL